MLPLGKQSCVRASALAVALAWAACAQQVPLKVLVLEGEGAINNIRERTAHAPVVRVTDDDARPQPGVSVTFMSPDMGASGLFEDGRTTYTTTTDRDGVAAARGLRPNNVAGRFQIRVTASRGGQTATALITQINAASEVKRGSSRKILIAALAAGGAAAVGAVFATRGGGGSSPAPSGPGGTSISPGSPVFGPPR